MNRRGAPTHSRAAKDPLEGLGDTSRHRIHWNGPEAKIGGNQDINS